MAVSKNNVLTHGLSGKLGDLLVFRNCAGKIVVASKPHEHTGEYSENQIKHRQRFQQATLYGQSVMADADLKKEYEAHAREGQSAYNVAVADYFHAPNIETIDVSNYRGNAGDPITITVTDDFKVTDVTVTIYNADGTEVEHGQAVQSVNRNQWEFTARAANESVAGDRIVVRATDLPGNETENSQQLTVNS